MGILASNDVCSHLVSTKRGEVPSLFELSTKKQGWMSRRSKSEMENDVDSRGSWTTKS
jgi:hypothetical protein